MSGMFGANPDWGQAISAALNGFLAAGGNQLGAANLRMMHDMRLARQQAEAAEAEYQRGRKDKRDDFMFEREYDAAHPAPDDFTRMMQSAGVDPQSEAGKALYLQALQNKANPFVQMRVQNPDGSESLQFMRPPAVPTSPVGNLRPLGAGGPTPPASGGFLGPF